MLKLFSRVQAKPSTAPSLSSTNNSTYPSALPWAIGLIGGGVLLLVWTLGLLTTYEPWAQIILALLLGLVGAGFFSGYFAARINKTRADWWRFIPAWTMVALALMVLLSTLKPAPVELIAALLFWGLAAAFWHIYLLQRTEHWWALIPGGFMLVLGGVIVLSAFTVNITILGALLFAGMGGVFFVLYALSGAARQWWSLIPGSVLVIFGLFILISAVEGNAQLMRWWPLLIILIGLAILWRVAGKPAAVQPSAQKARSTPNLTPSPRPITNKTTPDKIEAEPATAPVTRLGDYRQPAPGASIEILPDLDQP